MGAASWAAEAEQWTVSLAITISDDVSDAVVYAINDFLGSFGTTVDFIFNTKPHTVGISGIAEAITKGTVKTLLILGGNPAYNAPAALLFHYGPMGGPGECHIATTYAMLAAESLGLGSCMLGTTEALNQSKPFKSKYGIPPKNKIGLALVLGYPAVTFRRGVRRRLASVAFA